MVRIQIIIMMRYQHIPDGILLSKRQNITHGIKRAENRELLHVIGRNVKVWND